MLVVTGNHGVDAHLEPVGHSLVQSCTQVKTVVVVGAVVHDTVLIEVAQAHRVVGLFCAAGKVKRMAVSEGVMYQLFIPVGADAVVVGHILWRVRVYKVVHLNILLCVSKFHDVGGHLQAGIALVVYADLAQVAFPRGDNDDAICGTHTIDGSCRCILEHGKGLDIIAGEEVDIVHEGSVNHIERIGIVTDGAYAADLNGRSGTRGAALGNLYATDLALEGAHRVGGCLAGEFVTLDIYDGGGEVFGFLGTVAHYDYLFQKVDVLFEKDA